MSGGVRTSEEKVAIVLEAILKYSGLKESPTVNTTPCIRMGGLEKNFKIPFAFSLDVDIFDQF